MALHVTIGSGAPATVPVSTSQHYIDEDTGAHYISNGTDSSANWMKMLLMTDYVRISSDGYLQVKNETSGNWISLKGRDDPDGDEEVYWEEA